MMRCIVVDDEPLIRELLEDNIRQIAFLQLVQVCKSALEAVEILQKEKIDLILLDIQMPRLTGLQLLKSLDTPPLVIVITAYEKYALEGFDLNVVDYLLKPFSFERFLKACNRANDLFHLQQKKELTALAPIDHFFVNVEYTQVKIVVADIEYIEGLKDYIKIYLTSSAKPVLTRMTLKAIENKLKPPVFIRIHKSFLIASDKITTVKRDFVCLGKKELPLGDFYKKNINFLLNPPEL
ncbi:DNA-binding response regulator [Adhaeribacter arboris]|uniref:DNA-binding response regulator n=1 Tax=Adhaeribacter arboris TaxID=2072846 RepID=A0A2T2YB58_9BACT|nr:LytTR family DNA-binding domain-containing protein [Adhaeribacter arboris]PSR52678.1 DNA-binding response regulator [Adhaeribacter arboris]